ncbi:MAG TPA: choice-of-anchor R domain-containing protein [Candidatus Bilamarchaeum sp.]|nr:choice-of-anchor R domain-containing protein [Candidatus Bilamarchaeum sp.]
MRGIQILLICAVLLFGCTGGGQQTGQNPPSGGSTQPPAGGGACEPKYSFSELGDGVLSQSAKLVATVTCAGNKTLEVTLDGVSATSAKADSDATTPLELKFAPPKDGTVKLAVESDGEVVFSRDWTVKPLGSDDTKGPENDAVTFKEWRAMSVDVGSPIKVGKVKLFLKRIADKTQPGTNVVVELRGDSGGKPGSLIASSKKPITATTLSDNWITFDFPDAPQLSEGTKWIVLRIEQTEDVTLISDAVNIHYVSVDKQAEGNDYTRQMILNVDKVNGVATETSWTPLSYDRKYTIVVSAAG